VRTVVVQHVAGCSNVAVVLDRLKDAGADRGEIHLQEVIPEEPTPDGFAGSPTVLVEGINPLGSAETECSVSCTLRLPSVAQLREALARR